MRKNADGSRVIVDPLFADRLAKACDNHPRCPPKNQGRLVWMVKEFATRGKTTITTETARKWFYGESRPRQAFMRILAMILEQDVSYLSLGKDTGVSPAEREKRGLALNGAADLIAAIAQIDGASVSIPAQTDARSKYVHLYAIIKGALYALHATLDSGKDGAHKFHIPLEHDDCMVVAVVRTGGTSFDILEIPSEVTKSRGRRNSGQFDLDVSKSSGSYFAGAGKEKIKLTQISNFANRL